MNAEERNAAMDEWEAARQAVAEAEDKYDAAPDDEEVDAFVNLSDAKERLWQIEQRFPECRLPWPCRGVEMAENDLRLWMIRDRQERRVYKAIVVAPNEAVAIEEYGLLEAVTWPTDHVEVRELRPDEKLRIARRTYMAAVWLEHEDRIGVVGLDPRLLAGPIPRLPSPRSVG